MREMNPHPRWLLALRIVLIARCVLDLVFVWRIQSIADTSLIDLAAAFAPFALADGIAALIVAAVALEASLRRSIVMLASADGVLRVAAATTLHFGPGIPYFPMTAVLYIGLLAAFGLAFGIAETVAARQVERDEGWNPLSIALAIAGVATVALAATQFALLHLPNVIQKSLTIGIALQALTMLGVAAGASADQAASRDSAEIGRMT